MTTSTPLPELDEIVSDLILDLTSEVGWQEIQAGVKAGMAIRNWHKKHELQARIDEQMNYASIPNFMRLDKLKQKLEKL